MPRPPLSRALGRQGRVSWSTARRARLGSTLLARANGAIVPTMRRSPKHWLRALLLALLLALGMSVPLVQGSLMAAEMAVSAEVAQPCPHGCDGCADGDGDVDASTCLSLCGSVAQGLLPAAPRAPPPPARVSFQAGYVALGGRSHSPDPGPPRPL